MTTQTPRTDEAQYAPFPNIDPDELVVSVVVARQLERELSAANARLARLRELAKVIDFLGQREDVKSLRAELEKNDD